MSANLRQMPNRLGCLSLVLVVAGMVPAFAQEQIPAAGIAQIRALLLDKANRTPAQLKLDSQIIYNSRVALGQPAAVGVSPSFRPGALEKSRDGLIHVDISADVTSALLSAIGTLGGRVELSFPQYKTVRAWIPLFAAETLAGRADVLFVKPAERSHTNVASDTTGVIAHGANIVQAAGISGTGLKIGVLSDGVTSLAAEEGAGRLPATVNVISGQSGDGPGPCPSPRHRRLPRRGYGDARNRLLDGPWRNALVRDGRFQRGADGRQYSRAASRGLRHHRGRRYVTLPNRCFRTVPSLRL